MPVPPIDKRTAEDRLKMRKREKRYLDNHPERLQAIKDKLARRYAEDPEFRQRALERARLQREKRRLAQIQVESEPEQTSE